ncbi:MAG: tol-pal system protein YbgF [Lactobacillales bacterium]|jgi:tol-pal system protein YbgF|nr:tol-pal system protein YbgF [Lactobacillales bacterium]
MKKTIALFALLSIGISAPASADLKLEMLQDKIERLDREMTLLQREVYQRPAAGKPVAGAAASGNYSLDELYGRIDEQNALIQDLTSKLDGADHRISTLEEKIKTMNADMEMRFKTLSEKQAAAVKPAAAVPAKVDAKGDYDKAYDLLKKGDYDKAEAAFGAFLKKYPKSDLAGNANYWLGESYYARQKYEQAVGIFADGISKYKSNSKAADNMLKLGITLKALGKKDEACTAFKTLPVEFPKAAETLKQRAKDEAVKLSCP